MALRQGDKQVSASALYLKRYRDERELRWERESQLKAAEHSRWKWKTASVVEGVILVLIALKAVL